MSRYIDAEWLLNRYREVQFRDGMTEGVVRFLVEVNITNAPSIDIVRCKECKHWIGETEHYEDREYKACWQLCGQYMNSEFWCKYGEREGE